MLKPGIRVLGTVLVFSFLIKALEVTADSLFWLIPCTGRGWYFRCRTYGFLAAERSRGNSGFLST